MNWYYVLPLCLGGSALLVIAYLWSTGFFKTRFEKMAEAQREESAKQERINKEATEALRDKSIMVVCRRKDRGKTSFESAFMDHFKSFGAKVFFVGDRAVNDFFSKDLIPSMEGAGDAMFFIGTLWEQEGFRYSYVCDFRLMARNGEVKAASCISGLDEESLAREVVTFCGYVLAMRG